MPYRVFSSRQTGVALLTVLIVVFLASIAVTGLAFVQQLAVRRSTLLLHQQQARLYTLGGEEWAAAILERDREASDTDHLNETWATLPPALPVPGGSLSGQIEDLQGRFNLNNLLADNPSTPGGERRVDSAQLEILQRLLRNLDLSPAIAQAIADWIDPDLEPLFPDGAEDAEYASYDPPYLAANHPLVNVSELRLIKGVDKAAYERLAPYVSTLPLGTPINVNIASAPLLNALSEDLDATTAESLVDDRGKEGYASVDDFIAATGLDETALAKDNLAVTSDYFRVHMEAHVGDGRAVLHSVLRRDAKGTQVLMRSFGNER